MDRSDELLQIDTPENVVFGYEIAGIGSRFLAALIDTVIIAVILFIASLTFLALMQVPGGLGEQVQEAAQGWIIALYSLLTFIILWGYYIIFEFIWNGQTPGKRLMRLRVIRTSGTPVTLAEVLIRNLVRLVDFMPISYGVGVVSMFISARSQRLGDLAAGTLVVWDQAELSLESLRLDRKIAPVPKPVPAPESGLPAPFDEQPVPAPDTLPVERLTPQDIQMIQEYLSRRFQLSNSAVMGRQLVMRMHTRMGLPPDNSKLANPAQWLSKVLDEYHAKRK